MPTTRRRASAITFVLALVALCFAQANPAAADPIIPINWSVQTTTTLKSLNQTVVSPPGTFTGQVDLGTGALTGDLALPPARSTVKIAGLPLANAEFALEQAAPIQGGVDLATGTVSTTASFNVRLKSLKPTLLPINLVGNNCRTVSPVTVTLSGPFSLTGASTFTGTFTLPKFRDCGLFNTPLINLVIPGPGNTISATFGPPAP